MSRIKQRSKGILGFFIFIIVLILVVSISGQSALAIPNGGYARPELLIRPEDLKVPIDRKDLDVRIVDLKEKIKYLANHIPRAVNIWRPEIVDKDHPLPGKMALQAQIEELMGRLGIGNGHTLITYSDGPDGVRLWWILVEEIKSFLLI